MIWFFEKGGLHLRCEVRTHIEGDRYELVITDPEGVERLESFTNSNDLNRRAQALGDKWEKEGWTGPHTRFL
jgi:hypothetical protein